MCLAPFVADRGELIPNQNDKTKKVIGKDSYHYIKKRKHSICHNKDSIITLRNIDPLCDGCRI